MFVFRVREDLHRKKREADESKGGASLSYFESKECPEEYRSAIFDGRRVTRWHRIKDFQEISLLQIAEDMLLSCPSYRGQHELPLKRRNLLPDRRRRSLVPKELLEWPRRR